MSTNSSDQKPTILDVAHYILTTIPDRPYGLFVPMLQKLCYYSQVCSLVYYREPLVDTEFEAWKNGPVSPSLYKYHVGMIDFPIDKLLKVAEPNTLSQGDKVFIDKVLAVYDRYTGVQLQWMAQEQDPWKNTREAYMSHHISDNTIGTQSIIEYYSQFLHTE